MSPVLVTGGSGFVGSHCILQLLAEGHTVRTTVRNLKREARRARHAEGRRRGARQSPVVLRGRPRKRRGLDRSGRRLRLRAARRLADSAERSEARRRADRSRARGCIARAASRPRRSREARRAHLLVRCDRLRPQAADRAVRRNRAGPMSKAATRRPTSSPRRSQSARPGTSSRRKAASSSRRSTPPLILGPVLGPDYSPSIMIVQRMLDGTIPGLSAALVRHRRRARSSPTCTCAR